MLETVTNTCCSQADVAAGLECTDAACQTIQCVTDMQRTQYYPVAGTSQNLQLLQNSLLDAEIHEIINNHNYNNLAYGASACQKDFRGADGQSVVSGGVNVYWK